MNTATANISIRILTGEVEETRAAGTVTLTGTPETFTPAAALSAVLPELVTVGAFVQFRGELIPAALFRGLSAEVVAVWAQ